MSILSEMAYEKSLNDREDTLLEPSVEAVAEPTASLTSNEGIAVTHAPVSRKARLERSESNTTETQRNQDIIEFVSRIMPSENFNANHHIYTRIKYTDENGKEKTAMKLVCFFNNDNFREVIRKIKFHKSNAYYITKNGFFANQRTKKNGESCLFTLDNIVIDIDNHKNKDLNAVNYAVDKLIFLLQNDYSDKIPRFDVVRSGRGCQLWFRLETMHKAVSWLYQSFTRHLIDVLSNVIKDNNIDLSIDLGASNDLSRLVRLPYTYNQATGTQAILEKGSDYRYNKEELEEYFTPISTKKEKKKKEKKSENSGKVYPKSESTAEYSRLNSKRMLFIERIVSACNGAVTGRRDNITWLYYNYCCAVLGDRQEALEKVIWLNSTFTEPQTEEEIKAQIKSVDKVGYYKLKNIDFLEKINATLEERMLYTSMSETALSRDKARAEKTERDLKILELYKNGLTYQQIADEIGTSLATVKRKLKNSTENDKARIVEVIMNRVSSPVYPNSIYDVISQRNQFSGASRYVNLTSFTGSVSESVKSAILLYFADPSQFNEGFMGFYGNGRQNIFY